MKTSYTAKPPYFQVSSTKAPPLPPLPSPSLLSHPAPRPRLTSISTAFFVALFLWLNGWLHHIWCYFTWWYYGSTHVEPWYLSTRRTLLCVYIRHTTHTRDMKLTHPYKNMLKPTIMCSQHLFAFHWINNCW